MGGPTRITQVFRAPVSRDKVLDTSTVYPFPPRNDIRGAQAELAKLVARHKIELIAIGNGTGSRETERLVADMLAAIAADPRHLGAEIGLTAVLQTCASRTAILRA